MMNLAVSFFIAGHLQEMRQIATPCTIGRSSRANWVLTHPMLSRNHCILYDEGGELYLCDNDSLNGTQYRGTLVKEPVRLRFGDEFIVGSDMKFLVDTPIEKEPGADRLGIARQTTVASPLKGFDFRQSTTFSENPAPEDEHRSREACL